MVEQLARFLGVSCDKAQLESLIEHCHQLVDQCCNAEALPVGRGTHLPVLPPPPLLSRGPGPGARSPLSPRLTSVFHCPCFVSPGPSALGGVSKSPGSWNLSWCRGEAPLTSQLLAL